MEAAKRKDGYYTYADYCTWDDDERWELINGTPYAMAPAPGLGHQSVDLELARQISNYLKGKTCKVFIAPVDVRLNAHDADDIIVQPDVIIVCDKSKFDKDKKNIIGAPDFIAEILSPSNLKHDLIIKKKLYQEFGVREYWILDPELKTLMTYVIDDNKAYISRIYSEQDTAVPISILEDCKIDLSEVFADF